MSEKTTAKMIQRRLYFDLISSSAVLMPNFTPATWYECDIFRVTKAGYFYEYEVKISLSDFKADANKKGFDNVSRSWAHKHELLQRRQRNVPHRYYYVVPRDLTDKVIPLLPDWAGLIEYSGWLRQVKGAPQLHRHKISNAVMRQAERAAVHRYWDLFLRMPDHEKIQSLQKKLDDRVEVGPALPVSPIIIHPDDKA